MTDYDWYEQLYAEGCLDEVNFWKPSARRHFQAPAFSPFLFKLKHPHNAICGFGFFTGYFALPIWLAWDTFGRANGCRSLSDLRSRLATIRERIRFEDNTDAHKIGCITVNSPVFFSREHWVHQPADWHPRIVSDKGYDLTVGEGARVWRECNEVKRDIELRSSLSLRVAEANPRYGQPVMVRPRLGQGTFRVAVSDAYDWGCAATGEHSLPALEAAHIRPLAAGGPSSVANGLLLRADLHRLFDKGYITVNDNRHLLVSSRLKKDFNNGKAYYPLHDQPLRDPRTPGLRPDPGFLRWHNENVFLE